MRRRRTFITILAALLLAACSPEPPKISVEEPYATLSGLFVGAGSVFMKIRNDGGRDSLMAVSANIPGAIIELHDVKNNQMVKVERFAIPSRSLVDLRPGALHIMLFNMPRTIAEGSELVLSLTFERSGRKDVPVRFVRPGR